MYVVGSLDRKAMSQLELTPDFMFKSR